jgi:sec-independent protein translocase protein TatA
MFESVSLWELLLIFLIVLMIFGAGRLADIGKGLGEGVANFIRAFREAKRELEGDASSSRTSSRASDGKALPTASGDETHRSPGA